MDEINSAGPRPHVSGPSSDEASGGATRARAPPTAMIYMEPGLSPGYRHEEEEEGKEGLEEEEEEASPGFVDSWLRRWVLVMDNFLSATFITQNNKIHS